MVIRLHGIARAFEDRDPAYATEMREIADRLADLSKIATELQIYEKAAYHKVVQG